MAKNRNGKMSTHGREEWSDKGWKMMKMPGRGGGWRFKLTAPKGFRHYSTRTSPAP